MNIIIADDHPIVLNGLCEFLQAKRFNILASCINGIEAWNQIKQLSPDVVILDHNMPGFTGIEVCEKIKQHALPVKIILLTMHNEKSLLQKAQESGVHGFLLKDSALLEIETCIQHVYKGKPYLSSELSSRLVDSRSSSQIPELDLLTPAERKILKYISDQKTTAEIANLLFISEKTVEKHRKNIIQKLQLPPVKNSLLMWALEHKSSQW